MTSARDECEHGSLRRQCPLCERDAEITRLQAALYRWLPQIGTLRALDAAACEQAADDAYLLIGAPIDPGAIIEHGERLCALMTRHPETRAEIADYLRDLSRRMLTCGTAMDFYGAGDGGPMSQHGLELIGAARLAQEWAQAIIERADHVQTPAGEGA